MLDVWLQEFAREMEIEPLTPTSPGVYNLPLEENLSVKITALPQGFSLTASVVDCPTINREKFLTQVLLANLFGQGTRGSIIGLNEAGNILTLSKVVEYNVDYKEFRNAVEDFINTMDFWKEEARVHK